MARFFDIDLTGVKLVPRQIFDVPTVPGTIGSQYTVGGVLNWIISEKVFAYAHNRGDGRVSLATAESAENGVDMDVIGEVTIGSRDGCMQMNDKHSRFYGFMKRHIAGKMSDEEYKTNLSVRVVKRFIESYVTMAMVTHHRTHDKIKNPDLVFGKVWDEIKNRLSDECKARIGDKRWTVVSSMLLSLSTIDRDSENWNFPHLYSKRGQATAIANNLPSKKLLHVSPENTDALVEAIQYWSDLILSIKAEAGKANVMKITKSAGFFGFILTAKLSKLMVLPKMEKVVAQILKRQDDVKEICPDLCRGDRSEVVKFCKRLSTWLQIKPRQIVVKSRSRKENVA